MILYCAEGLKFNQRHLFTPITLMPWMYLITPVISEVQGAWLGKKAGDFILCYVNATFEIHEVGLF